MEIQGSFAEMQGSFAEKPGSFMELSCGVVEPIFCRNICIYTYIHIGLVYMYIHI